MTSSAGRIISSVANFLTCTHVARWLSLPSSPSQPLGYNDGNDTFESVNIAPDTPPCQVSTPLLESTSLTSDYQAILDEEFEVRPVSPRPNPSNPSRSSSPSSRKSWRVGSTLRYNAKTYDSEISDRQVRIRVEPDDPSSSHPRGSTRAHHPRTT